MTTPTARLSSASCQAQIVSVAIPLFAEEGFDRVTMEAVARAAGVDGEGVTHVSVRPQPRRKAALR